MTSLLDIGPLTEEMELHGVKLTIQGLTAGHIFQLFSKFPDMRKLLDAKQGSPQEVMLTLAPELIAKIIAMATGQSNNKEIEAKAKTMGAGDQLVDPCGGAEAVVPRRHRPFRRSGDGTHDVSSGRVATDALADFIELDDRLACAIQRLVANGHTSEYAWAFTPRQLIAWCALIERERMRVMAQQYICMRNADIEVAKAREYHSELMNLAGGQPR